LCHSGSAVFFMKNKGRYQSLEEIIKACAENDRIGQEQLYRLYFTSMVVMCRNYMTNEEDILSVVNDGFLKVFVNLTKSPVLTNVEGWIRRIIYNTMIDFHRSLKSYKANISLVDTIFDSTVSQSPDEDTDYIFRLIDKLPDVTKTVFTKYAIEGYSHREISEYLNIRENTSKWHLFEARKKLREWLGVHYLNNQAG